MWPSLPLQPERSAYAILLCLFLIRLPTECQLVYDWDYEDGPSDTESDYQVKFSNQRIPRPTERMSGGEVDRLDPEEALLLRKHLKGLYASLRENPTLMDRRLHVGSKKPEIPSYHSRHLYNKRSFSYLQAVPACPARTEWVRLQRARDINDTAVEVFQPAYGYPGDQWFYITTCDQEELDAISTPDCPNCCRGINRQRYDSHCMTKKSFVMALVRKLDEQRFDWNWIQVGRSCTCSISEL